MKFEIGLSFAGEDREYVEKVLLELSKRNITAFYDRAQSTELWGEHGGEVLGRIYTKECRYFMPFISKHYVEKAWPNFEFKIALTKAIQSQESFVLPVRIDDTKLTLLDESIFYLDSRQISPAEIARNAAVKLGYPVDDEPNELAVLPDGVSAATYLESDWKWENDPRVKRHQSYIRNKYDFWQDDSVWSAYATSVEHLSLSKERLDQTFLNLTTRYGEGLNYALNIITHAKGFTREFPSDRREKGEIPIETWACYLDGLVTHDVSLNQEQQSYSSREGLWLSLNAATYELTRFLQLVNEVLDPSDPHIDVVVLFKNLDDVVIPVIRYGNLARSLRYGGYHEPILIRIDRSAISDRDHWNKISPPVLEILTSMSNIFGASDLPQRYWDNEGILEYSKIGGRDS